MYFINLKSTPKQKRVLGPSATFNMKPPNINECQLSHTMFMLQQNVGFINSKDYIFKYHILLNGIYNTFAELHVTVYSVALTAFYVISSELVLLDPRLSSIDTGLSNGNYHVPIIFYLDAVYSNKQRSNMVPTRH